MVSIFIYLYFKFKRFVHFYRTICQNICNERAKLSTDTLIFSENAFWKPFFQETGEKGLFEVYLEKKLTQAQD